MKTLIVDDEPIVRLVLKLLFKHYGECEQAPGGKEAIELFEKFFLSNNRFDLICLDLLMPGVNGYEVLDHIREFEKLHSIEKKDRVKIIIITGLSDPGSCQKSFSEECDLFLTKPINDEKIHNYLIGLDLIKK